MAVFKDAGQNFVVLDLIKKIDIGYTNRMPFFLFLFNLIIAGAGGDNNVRKVVSPVGGVPVTIDDNLSAGIWDILVGRGELLGMFIKAVEDGNKDEDVKKENDNESRLAQLLVIETRKVSLDVNKLIFEFCAHAHEASLVNRYLNGRVFLQEIVYGVAHPNGVFGSQGKERAALRYFAMIDHLNLDYR